jgi:3-hydroxyisobutyrate dehydrogenase/2-hydroxy-3-oxopropionate reductase
MGLAMAKHLVIHEYPIIACDINKDNQEQARQLGAKVASTPADLGKVAAFIIVAVATDDEVNEVVLGANGALKTMAAGSVIAVSSTVAPATVKALEEAARARGVDILDAPICRGRWYADEGKLLALFGGKAEVAERAWPIYATFASDIAHLGAIGHGQVAKAMNNLLLWVNSIGLIEAGRIAETTGIELKPLRDALLISSGGSQALEDWDQISFTWALKDMQIVSKMADEAGLALPITAVVRELVKEARRIKATNPPKWTG